MLYTKENLRYKLRPLEKGDARMIVGLEEHSFKNPMATHEYEKFISNKFCHGFAIQLHGWGLDEVIGYVLYRAKPGSATEVHSMLVHPHYRRNGWGKLIMQHLEDRVKYRKVPSMLAMVMETNLGGLIFFKRCGFLAITMFQDINNNFEGDRDVIVMEKQYTATVPEDILEEQIYDTY